MERSTPRDPWIRFTLIFAALAVVSELVYYGVALESALFRDYLAALARISGWLLSLVVEGVQVNSTAVTAGSSPWRSGAAVTPIGCARGHRRNHRVSGVDRLKAWGIGLGILWLNLLNFVRIMGCSSSVAMPIPISSGRTRSISRSS